MVCKKQFQMKNNSGENVTRFSFLKEQIYPQVERVMKNSVNDVNPAHFLSLLAFSETEAPCWFPQ